ncbi:MAG: type II toxin-antitoxin system RelE/ParE family toxin [Rickettsiales bacterium]
MIKSFKHKGLGHYFVKDIRKGLDARDISKISRILDRLDAATAAIDMNIPGWDFHELKGNRKGVWSVAVRKNWKITFRFINGEALDVSLEDYH